MTFGYELLLAISSVCEIKDLMFSGVGECITVLSFFLLNQLI